MKERKGEICKKSNFNSYYFCHFDYSLYVIIYKVDPLIYYKGRIPRPGSPVRTV